jgi:hypothetical protein
MPAPTADQQITFLTNVQRILSEGQFTATYKYALLQALADIAVEVGDDSGDVIVVPTSGLPRSSSCITGDTSRRTCPLRRPRP